MKRIRLHALTPNSARTRIAAAKSDEPFMAALLDRGHRGHKDAVDQWTRLHQVAFADGDAADAKAPTGSRRRAAAPMPAAATRRRRSTDHDGKRTNATGAGAKQPGASGVKTARLQSKSKRSDRRESDASVLLPDPENPLHVDSAVLSSLSRRSGESESDWLGRLEVETGRAVESFENLLAIREAILHEIGFYGLEPGRVGADDLVARDEWRILAVLQNVREDSWQDARLLGAGFGQEFEQTGLLPIYGVLGPDGNIYHRLSFRGTHPIGDLLQLVEQLIERQRPSDSDPQLATALMAVGIRPGGGLGAVASRSIFVNVVAPRVNTFIRAQGKAIAAGAAMGTSLALSGSISREGGGISDMDQAPELPPLPGFEPPERPEIEESFEEASIEVEVVPGFDVPEPDGPKVLIFPDVSEEIYRSLIIERRERQETRDQIDALRDFYSARYSHWEHFRGGRDEDGHQLPEFRVGGPGVAFRHSETGKPGDSRPGSIYVDLTFRLPDGSFVHFQTVDVDRDGQPTERELRTARRLANLTGDPVYLVPKIWQLREIEERDPDFFPIEVQ